MPNKKNGGVPPICDDHRKLWVPVGCGCCIECMKQKAREWKIRLTEELKVQKYPYFVTLTFSPDSLQKLTEEKNLSECNAIACIAIRRFCERWRKKYKKSIKHWLITELGHEGTERIHIHGILFPEFTIDNELLENMWQYGQIRIGDFCTNRTINYIVKYVTKIDTDHKNYKPDIFCSAGIGKNYINSLLTRDIHRFNEENTNVVYRTPQGYKMNLPIYYRNHLFTEEEREKLWVQLLDKDTRFVRGIKIENFSTPEGYEKYMRILRTQQCINKELGYGDLTHEWKEKKYNVTRRMLMKGNGCDKL